MITLLASLTGFISSLIPEILKFLKDQNDKKHELRILDRQIEYNKINVTNQLEEININKDLALQNSLYSTFKIGVSWVDAMNGSVRPVLAYCFFIMYSSVKLLQYKAITNSSSIIEYIEIIWNLDDQAIFAGIISFYFGQRTFNKMNKYR